MNRRLHTDVVHPISGINPDHTPASSTDTAAGMDDFMPAANALLAAAYEADQEAGAQAAPEQMPMSAEPDTPECDGCLLRSLNVSVAGWYWCPRLGTWGRRLGCPVPHGSPPLAPADQGESRVDHETA